MTDEIRNEDNGGAKKELTSHEKTTTAQFLMSMFKFMADNETSEVLMPVKFSLSREDGAVLEVEAKLDVRALALKMSLTETDGTVTPMIEFGGEDEEDEETTYAEAYAHGV